MHLGIWCKARPLYLSATAEGNGGDGGEDDVE